MIPLLRPAFAIVVGLLSLALVLSALPAASAFTIQAAEAEEDTESAEASTLQAPAAAEEPAAEEPALAIGLGPGRATGQDALASYAPQNSCDPYIKPGVAAFRNLVLAEYAEADTADWGIVRHCSAPGSSEHEEGRAWDWHVDVGDADHLAAATDLLDWLIADGPEGQPGYHARALGIMYMIYDQKIWGSYRAEDGWRAMSDRGSRTANHEDHVHFSFSWDGARQRTSWWTGAAVAEDFGPCRPFKNQPAPVHSLTPNTSQCPDPPSLDASVDTTYYWYGHSGSAVRSLQVDLAAVGYPSSDSSGSFLASTRRAIMNLQSAYGLPVTGAWDALTRQKVDDLKEPAELRVRSAAVDGVTEASGRYVRIAVGPAAAGRAWSYRVSRREGQAWTGVLSGSTAAFANHDLTSGRYRVWVPAQHGRKSAASDIRVDRPSITVHSSISNGELAVNLGPNLSGNRSYPIQLQKWNSGSWRNVASIRSAGTAERGTFRLDSAGEYRVTVPSTYGFDGAVGPSRTFAPTRRPSAYLESLAHPTLTESGGRFLRVNINPNLSQGSWTYNLQRNTGKGFTAISTRQSLGRYEVDYVDVPSGNYRVAIPSQKGYAGRVGAAYTHVRPKAKASLVRDSAGVIRVNVGPNLSEFRSYRVHLQRKTPTGFTTVAKGRTVGLAEVASFTRQPRGYRYRAVVFGAWGYDSFWSPSKPL